MNDMMYWIGQCAVAAMASAGVLEAGRKNFDLFGVIIIALAASLGGGSVRDILLSRPVFWVVDQTYLLVALGSAFLTFVIARRRDVPARLFLIPDAIGLALFTIAGTKAALSVGAPWLVASFMGLTTGVMGGVLRDVLCNEEPVVFAGTLYATAAWSGALMFILLRAFDLDAVWVALFSGFAIFLIRIAALRWQLGLPRFRNM